MRNAIILAAGKGTRMKSNLTKVMHPLANKPIIGHIVDKLEKINIDHKVVVVGYQSEKIMEYLGSRVEYALQEKLEGTAKAVATAQSLKDMGGDTLIVYGDVGLITAETLEAMYIHNKDKDATLLTVHREEPGHYARVIRDSQGQVERVIEARDCNERQLYIQEVTTGVLCVKTDLLFEFLPQIKKNDSKSQYAISSLIGLLSEAGHRVQSVRAESASEVMGINNRVQLAKANEWLREKINYQHMLNGVTLIDPRSTYIGTDVEIEPDVVIYPNCHIRGKTKIASETIIYANCWLENAIIGSNTKIMDSRITDSEIADDVSVGPYAHIRMHAQVDSKNRIGNFVELKNTKLGYNSRCAHLTYLGDAVVEEEVNIGCGVVTVNYDGKSKHKTYIKRGAFVGSNSNLVAPVTIGENAVTAAGSTITKDVPDGDMAFARNRQENKPGLGLKYKKKEK